MAGTFSPEPAWSAPGASRPRKTVWPIVFGVIAILVGLLGLICHPIGQLVNMLNPNAKDAYAMFPDWWPQWLLARLVAGVGLSVLLLIGGILLICRRPMSRTLLLVYAIVEIPWYVVGLVLSTVCMDMSRMAMPNVSQQARTIVSVSQSIGLVVGIMVGALWVGAIVFMAGWLCRRPIRREVAGWSTRASAASYGFTR